MNPNHWLPYLVVCSVLSLTGCSDPEEKQTPAADIHSTESKSGNAHKEKITRRDSRQALLEAAGLDKVRESATKLVSSYLQPILFDFQQEKVLTGKLAIEQFRENKKNHTLKMQTLDPRNNLAGLSRRQQKVEGYLLNSLLQNSDGKITDVILPVEGKGYASILKGYLTIDLKTLHIKKLSFYQHGETPALGGQIMSNQEWLNQFNNKAVLIDNEPQFRVINQTTGESSEYAVDALSGATYTSQGVQNLINYWMGEEGYYPMLTQLHKQYSESSS